MCPFLALSPEWERRGRRGRLRADGGGRAVAARQVRPDRIRRIASTSRASTGSSGMARSRCGRDARRCPAQADRLGHALGRGRPQEVPAPFRRVGREIGARSRGCRRRDELEPLPQCSEEARECGGARRDLAAFDPADLRLARSGSGGQRALVESVSLSCVANESGRVHNTKMVSSTLAKAPCQQLEQRPSRGRI